MWGALNSERNFILLSEHFNLLRVTLTMVRNRFVSVVCRRESERK